jgi:hypothetical protein
MTNENEIDGPHGSDMAALTHELVGFCTSESLPLMSADELAMELLAKAENGEDLPRVWGQYRWLSRFVAAWEGQDKDGAQPAPLWGIAAAPFAVFFHADGYNITIERHDGPSPVRWTIEPPRLAKAIEAMLGETETTVSATSPDILAALELAEGWIDAERESEETGEGQQARWILDTVRAAIAKAKAVQS